jgi:hypothetical protein
MITDALHAYGNAFGRSWAHDRAKSVGASEIGQCLRRVWYSKHGTERDACADTYGYRVRGSVYEDGFFVPALRAYYGKRLRFAGGNQRTFFDQASPLSATPDGLLRDVTPAECAQWNIPPTECVLVECKSIGSFKPAELPKPEHEFQTQVQMGLVRQHGRYTPTAAIIVYTSAFDWSRVSEHAVLYGPAVFERAQQRARIAMASAIPQREGELAGARECRFCPFKAPCGVTELASLEARAPA